MIDTSVSNKLNWKFFYALLLTLIGHFSHYRKYPKVGIDGVLRLPHYYGHLFRVSGLVMEWGGSLDAVLLALLHDLFEDTSIPSWALLPFGSSFITKLDTLTQNPLLPKPLRKTSYIDSIVSSSDSDVYLVVICDKWDNWKCYEMENNITTSVLSYYSYFTSSLSTVCNHSLLLTLKQEVELLVFSSKVP